MRLLFLVPYVPSQIYVRPYNIIRTLARRGHAITLLTLGGPADQPAIDELRAIASVEVFPLPRWRAFSNAALAQLTSRPMQADYCWQPQLVKRWTQLLAGGAADWDAVHVEHLRGSRYALLANDILSRQAHPPRLVWDSVDSISHLFRQAARSSASLSGRWMARLELPRTERFERHLLAQLDPVLVTSSVDQRAFQELAGPDAKINVHVLPNGVDLDNFTPDSSEPVQPDTLVLSGKMSYHANVSMALFVARQVLPLIWEQRPQTQLWIVGKDPTQAIQALSADARISVTGTVPDLQPYLRRAAVALSPVPYGAGIQNKVLQAMACGTPVVANQQAISALDVRPGVDLLTGEDAAGLAQATLRLLQDPALRQQVGLAGLAYVRRAHDWNTIAARLEDIYRSTG